MAVSVTPDGATAATRPPTAGPYSETFTVKNIRVSQETYNFACSGSANITCGSFPPSIILGPSAEQNVTVDYSTGSSGSGTLTLTASSAQGTDAGSFTVPVSLLAPIVSLSPHTGGSRPEDDFDVLYEHATPPYRSMGAERQLTLVYNSAVANPRLVLFVNARLAQDALISGYRLEVARVGGGLLTLTNGTTAVYYGGGTYPDSVRLAAVIDPVANSLARGWHDVNVTVTLYTPNSGTSSASVSTRVLLDQGSGSLFGAGWNIAGLQRLLFMAGSDAVGIAEGDGAMSFYQRTCPTCAFVAPAGVSASLATATDPVKGSIYRRTYLDGSKVEFTSDGRMWRSVNRVGIVSAEMLWTDTLLTGIKDEAGKIITLGYTGGASASGKLQTITDPGGRVTTVWTDAAGKLYRITDPDSRTTQFAYNGMLLATVTDRNAKLWDYSYDALNRLSSTRAPQFTDFTGATVRPEQLTISPSTMVWQPSGPNGNSLATQKLGVRADTAMARLTDPAGGITRVAFDRFGLATKIVDALAQTTTMSRDTLGQVLTTIEPNGNSTTNTYNGYLLTQYRNNISAQTVTYSYLANSTLKEISGNVTARQRFYYHDGSQGLAGSFKGVYVGGAGTYEAPSGGRWALTRYPDVWDRDTLVIDGGGHSTRLVYDLPAAFGNVKEVTDPRGFVSRVHNDTLGRVDSAWTPEGGPYVTSYDDLNRVVTTKNPLNYLVRTHWGALTVDSVTDAKGQTYKFGRNALGWIVAQHDLADPTKVDSAFYDAGGRQRKVKTRRGDVITMSYDLVDRVTGISGPDFPADTFIYDPAGRWVVGSNVNGRDSSALDALGRPSYVKQRMSDGATSYTMTYSWDIMNRLTTRSAPAGGNPVTLKYTSPFGQLDTLCAASACVAFQRNSEGLPGTEVFNPTGTPWTLSHAFSSLHQSTRDSFSLAAPDTLFGSSIGYDSLGRLRHVWPTRSNQDPPMDGRRFDYDPSGRLTGACDEFHWFEPGGSVAFGCTDEYGRDEFVAGPTYTYDAASNRTDSAANASIGPGNRVTRFKGYQIDYDLNGNVWRKAGLGGSGPSDTTLLTWDARSRLTRVETWPAGGSHTVVTFGYDALDRRVKRSVNGVTQWFVYDGDHVIMDVDSSTGVVQAEYGYYPGVDNLFAIRTPSWTGIVMKDPQIGSVRGIANRQGGTTIKQYSYTAWGETQADTGCTVRPRLAGREYDQETRLYYNRARYYDPDLGRFLSEDAIGIEGGLNLYSYAENDPVNRRDPSGLTMEICVITEWLVVTTDAYGNVQGSYTTFDMSCTGGGGPSLWTPPLGYPSVYSDFNRRVGGGQRQPPKPKGLQCVGAFLAAGVASAEDIVSLTGIGLAVKAWKAVRAMRAFIRLSRPAGRVAAASILARRTRVPRIGLQGATRISGRAAATIMWGAVENASFGEANGFWDTVGDFIPIINAGKAWWRVREKCF